MTAVLWNTFEVIVNFYQAFIITAFTYKFLTSKERKTDKIAFFFTGSAIASLITLFNRMTIFESVETLVYWLVLFVYIVIFLNGNILKKIFASVFPWVLIFSITAVILNFAASLNNMTIEELVSKPSLVRLSVLLSIQAMVYLLMKLILINFRSDSVSFRLSEWTVVITVMVVSFITAAFIHMVALGDLDAAQRNYLNFSLLALLFINISVFHMINSLIKKNKQLKEMEILKITEQYQQQYIENTNQQYDSIKKIRHDIKNQLSTVYTLIEDGEYNEAMRIIKESNDDLIKCKEYVKTNDPVVNAIVNLKLSVASAMGIKTLCVVNNDYSGIDSIDLCNLLSNTLDNAITACSVVAQNKEKRLSLEIKFEDGYYLFIVRNTIAYSVLSENPDLKTSKEDTLHHGFGIKILKEISEKYNGSCHFFEDDDQFCCRIQLKPNL